MTGHPNIPMRPEELPQQRVTPVVTLPPRQAELKSLRNPPKRLSLPAKMPRTAKYLGQVEWAWSPNHNLVAAYYLSTDRHRRYWLLWVRPYDDNWGKWSESFIYFYTERHDVAARVAAIYLLLDAWRFEKRRSGHDHFHWINSAEFLTTEELLAIGREVWPEKASAS